MRSWEWNPIVGSVLLFRGWRDHWFPPHCFPLPFPNPPTRWGHRRCQPANQKESPYQNWTMLVPWAQTSSLRKCKKTNFCCLCHLVCGIFLWQLEQTMTMAKIKDCWYQVLSGKWSNWNIHAVWDCKWYNLFAKHFNSFSQIYLIPTRVHPFSS